MSLRGEELTIDGQTMDVNISGSLTAAKLTSDYEGVTRLELTIYDPLMDLMRSGALTRPGKPSKGQKAFAEAAWDRFSAARLNLDGISFRLAGAAFSYSYETRETRVIFEDELATVMRLRDEALKTSRGADTRAEFIGRLVSTAVKRANLPFTAKGRYYSPQAGQKQPIAEPDDEEGRTKGFAKGRSFKVKTATADSDQRKVLTTCLTEADRLRAGERATLALIDTLITENSCTNTPGGDADSSGAFQVQARTAASAPRPTTIIDPRTGNVHGNVTVDRPIKRGPLDPLDLVECTRYFLLHGFAADSSGAIKYAADHPEAEIFEIAQAMQGSGAGLASNGEANYGPWVEQAKDILDLWGGAGRLITIRESYEFRAGGRRSGRSSTWWDDSGSMAEEVRWRRCAHRNRVWFVPDEWLFERSATFTIDGEHGPAGLASQGVRDFDTSQVDIGLPTSELRFRVQLPRWGGPPGSVVQLENLGPLDGRWLIAVNEQDIYATPEESTLTLVRPQPKKKEPAPKTNTTQQTETLPETGSIEEGIVAMAKKAYSQEWRARYKYQQLRPYPPTLFPQSTAALVQVDCSSFVTLVYKAAGAKDPNGSGYNGSGNTNTLRANGKKTQDPQPGNIVLYTNPDHAAIYIGGDEVIGIGSAAGVRRHGVKDQPNRFDGYYAYEIGSGSPSQGPQSTARPTGAGWHPDAVKVEMENAGGFTPGAGRKIVHHTTEGGSISGAESAYRANRSSPHFTLDHDSGALHQHIPITRAARALVHAAGTPETNKAYAIQIEHVGSAASSGSWSDAAYDRIAELCRWIETNAAVPRTCDVSFSSPSRLSGAAFFSYTGHIGHVHVPGNDHTDPGTGFKIDSVI